VITTTINLANKQNLDHPKSQVVKKLFSSSPTCFTQVATVHQKKLSLVFCSHQIFPLVHALSPKPCLCSPRRLVIIVVDEMFLQHA
jgi:hypothetical protein